MAAITICRELDARRSIGVFLADLAEVSISQDRSAEARSQLAEAEALIRAFGNWIELGKLLCKRARCQLRMGEWTAAGTALREAEEQATAAGASADSPLCKAIAELRPLLGQEPDTSGSGA